MEEKIKKYYIELSTFVILVIGFIGLDQIESKYLTIEDGEFEELSRIATYLITSAYWLVVIIFILILILRKRKK